MIDVISNGKTTSVAPSFGLDKDLVVNV